MMTMTTTPSAAHARASGLLNRLITPCNDGARAQDRAALVVNGAKRRARLEDSASRRLAFANELAELVRSFGGTRATEDPRSRVSALPRTGSAPSSFGENGGDAYSTCARVEAHAERLYEVAITAELPGPARLVVA